MVIFMNPTMNAIEINNFEKVFFLWTIILMIQLLMNDLVIDALLIFIFW